MVNNKKNKRNKVKAVKTYSKVERQRKMTNLTLQLSERNIAEHLSKDVMDAFHKFIEDGTEYTEHVHISELGRTLKFNLVNAKNQNCGVEVVFNRMVIPNGVGVNEDPTITKMNELNSLQADMIGYE